MDIARAEKPAVKHGLEEDSENEERNIRCVVTCGNVKDIEHVCRELVERAKRDSIQLGGVVRLPTKKLSITTRKTPCGEGSKTWDKYHMKIHKRIIDLVTTKAGIRKLTKMNIPPGVDVDLVWNK